MQYNLLGNTGVFVSKVCLGAMTFGGPENPINNALGRLPQADTNALVRAALEAGVNFFDTADVYSNGDSEQMLGLALAGERQRVILATKAHARTGSGPNEVGQSRVHIMQAVEGSLRRLQTDHIDLYQIHNFDPLTPVDEMLRAMDDLVRQGKVRYVGCSNLAAWQIAKALGVSQREGLAGFVCLQAYYSVAGRDIEREIVPLVLDQKLGLLCWSPLAGGLLSGKFDRTGVSEAGARRSLIPFPPVDVDRTFSIIDVLRSIAARRQVSVARIALAWLLAQPAVTSVIIGAKRIDQLVDNLGALEVLLDSAELQAIDAVSRLPVEYPGWIHTFYAKNRVPQGYAYPKPQWGFGEEPV